jgi:hypothetical protein
MATFPTVHMNGTSKAELMRLTMAAMDAADDFFAALAAMTPNGRDYYPQGDQACNAAMAEHRARIVALTCIKAELVDHAEAISAQGRG